MNSLLLPPFIYYCEVNNYILVSNKLVYLMLYGLILCLNRKNKHKIIKVVQQEGGDRVLCDKWNWRKYGEKVIKGSPYPRFFPLLRSLSYDRRTVHMYQTMTFSET